MVFMYARIKLDFHSNILDNQPIIVINFFWWIISIYVECHFTNQSEKIGHIFQWRKLIGRKKQVTDQKVKNLSNFSWPFDFDWSLGFSIFSLLCMSKLKTSLEKLNQLQEMLQWKLAAKFDAKFGFEELILLSVYPSHLGYCI